MSGARRGDGRDRLISAAKDLLWETGYEQMSPGDVLRRSGIGQGSLYHHFDGKLALALAALDAMVAEEKAAIDAVFAAEKSPRQRIADYLGRERQALRGCRLGRLANETAMETPAFRAAVADYLGHVEMRLAEAVREGHEAGTVDRTFDPQEAGALFLAAIEGGYVLARAHWDDARMRRALAGAQALLRAMSVT